MVHNHTHTHTVHKLRTCPWEKSLAGGFVGNMMVCEVVCLSPSRCPDYLDRLFSVCPGVSVRSAYHRGNIQGTPVNWSILLSCKVLMKISRQSLSSRPPLLATPAQGSGWHWVCLIRWKFHLRPLFSFPISLCASFLSVTRNCLSCLGHTAFLLRVPGL